MNPLSIKKFSVAWQIARVKIRDEIEESGQRELNILERMLRMAVVINFLISYNIVR